MTIVNLKYRRIDGVNPEGVLITSGLVDVTPAYRSDTGSGQMTTITESFPVGSSITLAAGTYLFRLRASDGHGGRLKDEGVYRLVPASGTFDVDDLVETNPVVGSVTQSDVAAMIQAAVAGLIVGPGGTPTGSGPGGAFVIADVTDSTTTGRAVVKAVDPAAGRTALSAAAATHTHGVTDLTATGTRSGTTFLRGDNTWSAISGVVAGSVEWDNVANKPATFPPTTPIPQASVTGLATLASTVASNSASIAALSTGQTATAQEMIWNGNTTSTNATAYGAYDVTRTIHNFRGARNPLDAGYTMTTNDFWFQPEVLPVDPDPTPPTTITLTVTDKTTTGFRVNWTAVPGSTGYRVSRNAGGGGTEQPWPTTPAGTATDGPDVRFRDIIYLVAGATYVCTVQALPSNITASVTVNLNAATPPTEPLPPPTTTGDNKYGFMVFLGSGTAGVDQDIAGIKAAGGTWARLGMYNAGSFNASGVFVPTTATWDHFKYACQTAKAAGLKVIWDAADTLRISSTLTDAQWIVWQKSMWKYMAQTLGPWVDAWQIFNEHDGRHIRDFSPVPTLTTAYLTFFRDALQGARNSIREHHTGPVGTTVFGYPMDAARLAKWFQFHDAVSGQMDYIGLHAYPEFNGAVLTDYVNQVYARYNKPVAVLEFGVPDAGGYGTPPLYLRVGDGIVIQNNALLACGKSKFLCNTLFSLRNRVQGGTGEGGFGILDNNWAKKAYWQTVVNSIARWN